MEYFNTKIITKKNQFITAGVYYFALLSVVALGLLSSPLSLATQADVESEANEYVAIFSGSNFPQQKEAMTKLRWSGLDSNQVYSVIADKLRSYKEASSKLEMEQGAWFAKALSYSGMEKYRPVLEDMAANASAKKIRKYAKQSIDSLNSHIRWNPIIRANLANAPAGQLQQQRVLNMLASNESELLRLGAKQVYFIYKSEPAIVSKVAQRLKAEYSLVSNDDKVKVDAIAWLIRALAESGDKQYQPLLAEIADQAKHKKIKKYAKKHRNQLL